MKSIFVLISILSIVSSLHAQMKIEPGVSHELAISRKQTLSNIDYVLHLAIPENKKDKIVGTERISFNYKKQNNNSLQLDFKATPDALKSLKVNNQIVQSIITNEHIVLDGKYLQEGKNTVVIEFDAGDGALNRREGYLYTLFVPDRARTMFPCFDQPDLKAHFTLSLDIPKDWQAIANGKLLDSTIKSTTKTFRFTKSDILPTYLFSFAAGYFSNYNSDFKNQNIQLLYRETDFAKIKNSLDSIIQLYTNSINYYEKWTGIPYPFQKHGMVSIPDFQFGGMEHPGAILLQNGSLFLDKNATQNQLNARSNLMAHEVAHQWFGDMVTMDWFTDVWMKEVFANFMADKSTGALTNKDVYDLKFITTHFPAAYSVDRTLGANPIRQSLDNLQNAGMLYGAIIYAKAPIMMRQLEMLMGEDNFQKSVNIYLKKYAYSNASWPDLISILDSQTKEDLQSWNKTWVNETGRPIVQYKVDYKNDKIEKIVITQSPEYGKEKKIWKQRFQIALYYTDTIIKLDVPVASAKQELVALKGIRKPLFLQLNSSGIGYGVFAIDSALYNHFSSITDPVSRASAYTALYENMLNGVSASPEKLLQFFANQLASETTELSLRLMTNYMSTIYWAFISKERREQISIDLETKLWSALQTQTVRNNRKNIFDTYQNVFLSKQAYDRLYQIWKSQTPPENVVLNDDDYTGLALSLALRNSNNGQLLQEQLARIKNPDRVSRFKIITQAASSDKSTRDTFFYSLIAKTNRSNESAVGAALSYLHHPLRQESSIDYLPKTLELLQEIQKTGDIFFPYNWLQAAFSFYQDPRALKIVDDFIRQHPDYNPVLRNKILQTTDNLRRTQKLLEKRS